MNMMMMDHVSCMITMATRCTVLYIVMNEECLSELLTGLLDILPIENGVCVRVCMRVCVHVCVCACVCVCVYLYLCLL